MGGSPAHGLSRCRNADGGRGLGLSAVIVRPLRQHAVVPPRGLTAEMQPDAVRVTGPSPMVQEAELAAAIVAAMTRTDQAFGDRARVVGGGLGRGGIAL